MKETQEIYDDNFVKSLFDRMSKTYGITNYISSFGFTERWRKKCVKGINWTDDTKQDRDNQKKVSPNPEGIKYE